LKSYRIYENIETFRKVLAHFNISNTDKDIYNRFTNDLLDDEVEDEGKKLAARRNLLELSRIMNVNMLEVKERLFYLFWKMGYNLKYIKKSLEDKENPKFQVKIYDTIYKQTFTKDIICSKLEYFDKLKMVIGINNIGDGKSSNELEDKMQRVHDMIDNKMKTLFEIRSNNIRSIKALLGILNKVFNNFGFMIKTIQEGNCKNRNYIYKFLRLEILEEYLERAHDVVEEIEM